MKSQTGTAPIKQKSTTEQNEAETAQYEPYIRLAESPTNPEPILQSAFKSLSQEMSFGSPIYYLGFDEIKEQHKLENPYAVSGKNIAKKLQDKAEAEGRVYYPLYIESDAEISLEKQIDWIEDFCLNYLNTDPSACTWYFSGGRSIHAHLPNFVKQNDLEILRKMAKEFEYDIDSQIYTKKRLFRLPGTSHEQTELPKVKIEPEWSHERIIKEATESDVKKPQSFAEVLTDTFPSDVLKDPENHLWEPKTNTENEPIDPGLNSWERFEPYRGANHQKWKAHYSHPVSPYANAGNGNRSLLIAKVIDGPFGEKRDANGDYNGKQTQTFVPCQLYNFWACDRKYQIEAREYRPIQLSKPDYEKFTTKGIQEGDFFVLIGGQSRKSRIYKPRIFVAKIIAGSGSFSEAIETLEAFDYDTGESGYHPSNYRNDHPPSKQNESRAFRLQKQAEEKGIESLTHGERLFVMLRQLSINRVDGTRNWFKEQYGDNYDPKLTNKHIRSACNKYDWTPNYSSSNITRKNI
ncbi:hypothetical protein [Natronorubrum aibiense]|uniref:DNA primase n=1 Tax=Natronorubrum aibiense TaxID=348826 RepID=A0A5P9P382_9EURY|nr:hypothetical protein [Natronorubrum aibiense]QFU82601.1 hypothetical protein GCU68_08745 [Natronorubrum aibiense]